MKLSKRVFTRFGLEKALTLAFWTELGLRREESAVVAVEDFWIDNNGYLMQDECGFGKCYFPEAKSKATGADDIPLLVLPSLVIDINHYLKQMYSICPFVNHTKFAGKQFVGNTVTKTYEEGHGFFFERQKQILIAASQIKAFKHLLKHLLMKTRWSSLLPNNGNI